jgi:hypothetical protein
MLDAVTIAVVVGSVAASLYSSEKARSENKKASRTSRRIQEKQNQREKLKQIREGRIGTAQIEQASASQGTAGSSATRGGVGALNSNVSSNIAFLNQVDSLQQNIQRNLEAAGKYQAQSAAFGQIASLAAMAAPTTPVEAGSTTTNSGTSTASTSRAGIT